MAKSIPLEGLRGLAALSVVLGHIVVGFYPNLHKSLSSAGNPLIVFINGYAMVNIFFVLSGFVLTRAVFGMEGREARRAVLTGVIKRWPRLMLPVAITVLGSWSLFHFDLYSYQAAGKLLGSSWLETFAEAYDGGVFQSSFWKAFLQGTVLTFFRGDCDYNTSLWTLRIEVIGSFVAFSMALLLIEHRSQRILAWYIGALAILLCHFTSAWGVAFPIGVLLAYFLPDRQISVAKTIIAMGISAYLLGYSGVRTGAYAFVPEILQELLGQDLRIYINTVGAVLVVACFHLNQTRSIWNGRFFQFLGELSFPIYLVHVPVLCSLGAYIILKGSSPAGEVSTLVKLVAGLATFFACVIVSLPLIRINQKWLTFLNSALKTRLQ